MLIYAILALILSTSAYTDLFYGRIYNFVTLPAIVLGIAINAMANGLDGVFDSLVGFGLGFSLYFLPYLLGMVGGGDVKLMSAVGALAGWKMLIGSVVLSSAIGGVLAVAVLLRRRLLSATFQSIFHYILALMLQRPANMALPINKAIVRIPYGVAIALGTALATISGFNVG